MPINIKFPSGNTGLDTSDATAAADKILEDYTAYVNGVKITGTIQSKPAAQYTPTTIDQVISGSQYLSGPQTISGDVNLTANNIAEGVTIFGVEGTADVDTLDWTQVTATANSILTGFQSYDSNKNLITGTIPSKASETYTPSTTDQIITSGQYLTGTQTISGDVNLVAGNIVDGVTIFGVAGNYEGLDTSDATATAAQILSGETAYVNGVKVTGTIPNLPQEYQVILPSTEAVVIYDGYYIDQGIGVVGEPNLLSSNIKSGVSIFGVSGDTNIIDTTETTAPASNANLLTGHVAFVNGQKITGSLPSVQATTYTPTTTNQTIAAQQFLVGNQTILGDTDLIASNIKDGVELFGIEGTYSGGSLSQNWCFEANENALTNYGALVYFETIGTSGGPTISTPMSLTDIVASYSGICDESTSYCIKIGSVPFGWGSTIKIIFLTPINITGSTIFLDTISTGDSATPVTRLVQATGSGAELAANIFANSQIDGSYVDISGYQPYTAGNFITTAMYNTMGIPTGTYYMYLEMTSNNFSPNFKELFQYVSS